MCPEETSIHVRRASDGDAESLAWLVERLSPLLVAQARYRLTERLRRHVDPEDLVQEVWAIALPRLGDLEPREGRATPVLLRFLATTLLHQVNNIARRAMRRDAAELPVPPSAPGLATQLTRGEAHAAVHACIDELDDVHKEILVLRGIEQLEVSDVAQLLAIKPEAVRQRWSRALKQLRARLPQGIFDEL